MRTQHAYMHVCILYIRIVKHVGFLSFISDKVNFNFIFKTIRTTHLTDKTVLTNVCACKGLPPTSLLRPQGLPVELECPVNALYHNRESKARQHIKPRLIKL